MKKHDINKSCKEQQDFEHGIELVLDMIKGWSFKSKRPMILGALNVLMQKALETSDYKHEAIGVIAHAIGRAASYGTEDDCYEVKEDKEKRDAIRKSSTKSLDARQQA